MPEGGHRTAPFHPPSGSDEKKQIRLHHGRPAQGRAAGFSLVKGLLTRAIHLPWAMSFTNAEVPARAAEHMHALLSSLEENGFTAWAHEKYTSDHSAVVNVLSRDSNYPETRTLHGHHRWPTQPCRPRELSATRDDDFGSAQGLVLEMLAGPLPGIYDPSGRGRPAAGSHRRHAPTAAPPPRRRQVRRGQP